MQNIVLYTMRKCKVLFSQLEANIFAEEITPINSFSVLLLVTFVTL